VHDASKYKHQSSVECHRTTQWPDWRGVWVCDFGSQIAKLELLGSDIVSHIVSYAL